MSGGGGEGERRRGSEEEKRVRGEKERNRGDKERRKRMGKVSGFEDSRRARCLYNLL